VKRGIALTLIGWVAVGVAQASPYWVAWEGDDYPENQGWQRVHYGDDGPPAIRSLANGVMTLDGRASIQIIDAYQMERPLNPGSGEEFVAQWRLSVDEVNSSYPYDPGFEIRTEDGWLAVLVIGTAEIHSILEQRYVAIPAGGFLDWEFRSTDMRAYTLWANGILVDVGLFVPTSITRGGRVIWGDDVFGASSASRWDYFRFGVVPEPVSGVSLVALLLLRLAANRRCL